MIKAVIYFLVIKFGYYGRNSGATVGYSKKERMAYTKRQRENEYAGRY